MKDYHPPSKKKKKKKRFWIITFTTIWVCYHYYGVFFAHLLILQYPDHHQNLISSYLYYSGPVHKISSQSVHNFLSNVVHRQTNRQTVRQTNQRYRKHNLLCQGGHYNYFGELNFDGKSACACDGVLAQESNLEETAIVWLDADYIWNRAF